jgi:protein-tyrosine phosphatase
MTAATYSSSLPHHVMPQRLDELMFSIVVSGYVPVLTHPERLKWIEQDYATVQKLAQSGVWMQITAGSLTGRFGRRPQYWAQRMLSEGLVSLLATDAHNTKSRPPLLAEARDLAVSRIGPAEAENLVSVRPAMILENRPPEEVPMMELRPAVARREPGFWQRLFGATTQY